VPGRAYIVAEVVDGSYVVLQGFGNAETGGLYWTEFERPSR
jgi:hypothetical protein